MNIALSVEKVSQWFESKRTITRIIYDINVQIVQGQFVALVGASGCGKSTLLKAILGTNRQREGSIKAQGIEVNGPNRNVGIVYQKYGLYQFLTAE